MTLHNKIIDYLTSLPQIHESKTQQVFIYHAGLDPQLQKQIVFGGSALQFAQELILLLSQYGKIGDGRYALEAFLEATTNYVGQDRKTYCEILIQELRNTTNIVKGKIELNLQVSEMNSSQQIFISYAREDRKFAERLYYDLKRYTNIKPWIDSHELLPGQDWKLAILQAIKESSYFLALLSSRSVSKKGFVQKELKIALDLLDELSPSEIFIIPVRLDNCQPANEKLRDLHWADIFPSYEAGLNQIIRVFAFNANDTKQIIDRSKKNLQKLLQAYLKPKVYLFALSLLKNPQYAETIVQDVFNHLLENFLMLKKQSLESFESFVIMVTKNSCIKFLQKQVVKSQDLIPSTIEQNQLLVMDDLICVEPKLGEQYVYEYLDSELSEIQRQDFENHLLFCLKCQEDIEYMRNSIENSDFQSLSQPECPLSVTSVFDYNRLDLTDVYYSKPLLQRLAAASETSGELVFPLTIEYLDGQIIGEFWKRAGYLSFRLKKSTIHQETFKCLIIYTSTSKPSDIRVFKLNEGEEKLLGKFHEFVPLYTIQSMIDTMRQFQLLVDKKD